MNIKKTATIVLSILSITTTCLANNYRYIYNSIPDNGFKAYMPYTAVTSKRSKQYKILNDKLAWTNHTNGVRMYGGYWCVAIGSGWGAKVGDKLDLYLANGTVIPSIMADQKADRHTKNNNRVCISNGGVAEFIVDYKVFNKFKDRSGTVNFIPYWNSKIISIKVKN